MNQIPLINQIFHTEQPSSLHSTTSLDPPDILPPRQGGGSTPSVINSLNAITGYSFPRETVSPTSLEKVFTNPKKISLDNAISLFLAAPIAGFTNDEKSPFKEG